MKLWSLKKRVLWVYLPLFLLLFFSAHIAGIIKGLPPVIERQDIDLSHVTIPIVYDERYNISLFGIEELHPFDSKKYGRVFAFLKEKGLINESNTARAGIPSHEDLFRVHSKEYLESLHSSWTLSRITELRFLRFFPTHLSVNTILVPMLYQAGGSLLAADLAIQKGWAINLGGGFHHASANNGEGFCALADISMAVEYVKARYPDIKKIMIVDLDAHQGNGHETDYIEDENVFIFDMYNAAIYPYDEKAKRAIDMGVELAPFTVDASYLWELKSKLPRALDMFSPDMIFYIAGSDILKNDPLGALAVSEKGYIKRDEYVFEQALGRTIPIVMLFGGGYQKENAQVIARSIENLNNRFETISTLFNEAGLSE